MQATTQKVHLVSLGCARNRVDSEVMLGTLLGKGWEHTDQPETAAAIIVNTCGFIDAAKKESIDTILGCAEYKKVNPKQRLVVAGCLTQRYKSQLARGLPEVDLFVGTDEFPRIGELLQRLEHGNDQARIHARRSLYLYDEAMPRVNTLTPGSAYVKVAEGCQHRCSFCIIPAIRGPLRSRTLASVVREVEDLTRQGVREINLIAQDLAAYGRDRGSSELLPLLQSLVFVKDLDWIRLLYVYPEHIDDALLDLMAGEQKIAPYLDMPMQHASDRILHLMKRDVTGAQLRQAVDRVRERVPGIALRTSVMVGFPSETDEDFALLEQFVTETEFDHLGCFTYSQEEGTVAGKMPHQIGAEVSQRRQQKIMEIQREISARRLTALRGQIRDIMVVGPSPEDSSVLTGRLKTQAPEVDGIVYLTETEPLPAGKIIRAEITETYDYDLVARPLQMPLLSGSPVKADDLTL